MPNDIQYTYDPNDQLSSPLWGAENQPFDSPNSLLTSAGIGASNGSNSNSPEQSVTEDIFRLTEFEFPADFECLLENHLGGTSPQDVFDDILSEPNNQYQPLLDMNTFLNIFPENENDQLQIIAQPNETYRLRYATDSKTNNGQGHRFIRTGLKDPRYEYPTIKFSPKYCDPTRELYIKVTPVTIISGENQEHYIHPYKIGTEGNDHINDSDNSLYFRIQTDEFTTCEKKLQITQTVTLQKDLRKYGPLRKYNIDSSNNQYGSYIQNPKELIATYQLQKFQFKFSIAERLSHQSLPVSLPNTEVTSKIMTGEEADKKQPAKNHCTVSAAIKCFPRKASIFDGEEIAICMPYPIKNKIYSIRFCLNTHKSVLVTDITPIDQKTFSFFAPACPFPHGDHNLRVQMVITENYEDLGYIDFTYFNPMRVALNVCSECNNRMMTPDTQPTNKRSCSWLTDVPKIIGQLNNLNFNEETNEPPPVPESSEPKTDMADKTTQTCDSTELEKILNKLQAALVVFVRTNDPSKLFRQTRSLLAEYDENPPPLHEAIERGHISLVSTIIEQVTSMLGPNNLLERRNDNGENVLLVAARCNQWKVIEPIVKKREDVIETTDKEGNNMLHLLASVKEDAGAETIKNVLEVLCERSKNSLLKQSNKGNKTAGELAQLHENKHCFELLTNDENDA